MSPPGRPKGEYRRAQPEAVPVSGADDDRCPRCGGGFHCGMHDDEPCGCTSIRLDAQLQRQLRERWTGCLCLSCLQALARGESVAPPSGLNAA